MLFLSPRARWNVLVECETKPYSSRRFGRSKQAFSAPLQWYLPDKHNNVFTGEHGHENKRGTCEAVNACFVFHHGRGGTFWPSVTQTVTPLGVLGDNNKLFPGPFKRTSRRTPNHVWRGEHDHENERRAREAVKACLFF